MDNMHVSIEWREGQYPTFKVALRVKPESEPFLEIKDCRIVNGRNGDFISYPARKDAKTDKWWPQVYGGEAFNAHVLQLAQEGRQRPEAPPPRPPRAPARPSSGFDDMQDDPPF